MHIVAPILAVCFAMLFVVFWVTGATGSIATASVMAAVMTCLIAGGFGAAQNTVLGLAFTGAALVLWYPAFIIADAPLSLDTYIMTGWYFAGWGAAFAGMAAVFGLLTLVNNR